MSRSGRIVLPQRPQSLLLLPVLILALLSGCSDDNGPDGGAGLTLTMVDVNSPIDITPDGSVAVLEDLNTFEGKVYLYNTSTGVLTHVTDVGDPGRDLVTGISADGRISALHADPVEAGLWTQAGGWFDLPHLYEEGCGQDFGGTWDISADGHVAVGLSWHGCNAEAFRWSDASGSGEYTPLELLGTVEGSDAPPTNRASVISDDGTIAAGFAQDGVVDRRPAIWRADGSGFMLNPTVPDAPGEVLSISADGHMVAGIWNQDAFYWTEATNVVNIGHLPSAAPGTPTFANAIAADGALIFGANGDGFSGGQSAMVWTAATGIRSLDQLLRDRHFIIPEGFTLTNVLATSTDGTVVIGTAQDDRFNQKTFVLKAPVSLYGL